jgi:hypothetical protein
MSTSVEASAKVDASGFIWLMKGHAVAAAPTAAAAPVAMKRKSLRVGSTEEAVDTSNPQILSLTPSVGPVDGRVQMIGLYQSLGVLAMSASPAVKAFPCVEKTRLGHETELFRTDCGTCPEFWGE